IMLRSRFFAILTLLAFVALILPHPTSVTKAETVEPSAAINVACVFATGGLGDKSFNDMAKLGLDNAIADGIMNAWGSGSAYSEPNEIEEYIGLLENYASAGTYDLIVSIGFDQATAVNETAKAFPTQKIVLIDMVVTQGSVRSVVYNTQEGSFLVGAMAGYVTKTDMIGFVGGMDNFIIRPFWAGYKAGAFYVNRDVEVLENFVGNWDDPATAKAQAEALYAAGCDIVFVAAGKSGLGALEAASQQTGERYAIGVDADQDGLYPGDILCSMMKRVDLSVYNAVSDVSTGADWPGGIPGTGGLHVNGLGDHGVGISPMTHTQSIVADYIEEVNVTLRGQIVSGDIVVPDNEAAVDEFIEDLGGEEDEGEDIPGFTLLIAVGALAAVPIILRRRR
ncbi:MAG: BMP family ABC transporter substrate-binding protein, partial [Candidatus Hodarchaeota archaeon]